MCGYLLTYCLRGQVAAETETPSMPHMHGGWPHYVNDEDKHLYYYYPWGRW